MSDLPPPRGGYWQASDGNWYAPEMHPDVRPLPSSDPPSGTKALVWTLLAAFWLWLLLPVAIYYNRRARREAEMSNGQYVWSRSLLHRPILLWLVVYGCVMALFVVMVVLGIYGD